MRYILLSLLATTTFCMPARAQETDQAQYSKALGAWTDCVSAAVNGDVSQAAFDRVYESGTCASQMQAYKDTLSAGTDKDAMADEAYIAIQTNLAEHAQSEQGATE